MKSVLMVCLTAIVCVSLVLGYIEYSKRSALQRDAIVKAKLDSDNLASLLSVERKSLNNSVDEYVAEKKAPAFESAWMGSEGKKIDQMVDRSMQMSKRRVSDDLDSVLDTYIKSENSRREYEGLIGQAERPFTQEDVDQYKASVFKETPHLLEAVGR